MFEKLRQNSSKPSCFQLHYAGILPEKEHETSEKMLTHENEQPHYSLHSLVTIEWGQIIQVCNCVGHGIGTMCTYIR